MIDRLRGEVLSFDDHGVVIGVGGVGYWVQTTRPTAQALGGVQGEVALYTHLHVRQDALELYGFSTPEERELFRALIGVSGVGPKVALGILSEMSAAHFQAAVLGERLDLLQRLKGIGRKTAERLILELKGPLAALRLGEVEALGPRPRSDQEEAAFVALTRTLGFGAQEARRALEHARDEGEEPSTEQLIKRALAWLSGGR